MALCSQFNALHLYHSNEKWRRQQKKVADSNNDNYSNTKNLCRTRDKVEVRFLVIWFANANSLPFDAYGFNLYVLFCSPYISHGHRYHYTNTQLCKCGEMEMIVSLLWFDLSALFSLLEKQRHISSKRNKRIILTLFFKRWISNSFIHPLHMLIRNQEFFVSFYLSCLQQSNKNHFTPLKIPPKWIQSVNFLFARLILCIFWKGQMLGNCVFSSVNFK